MVNPSKKTRLILGIAVGIILLVTYKIIQDRKLAIDLKKSVVLIATVQSIDRTRGMNFVNVEYVYNGDTIKSDFGTYDRDVLDSLKPQTKVLLRISIRHPKDNIEYIGVKE